MNKVLIGLANNVAVNKHKVKVWANSFMKHTGGEVMLLAANTIEADERVCEELGIHYIKVDVQDTWYINHKRLEHTLAYLIHSSYDQYIITDVFDVSFQADPFTRLDWENYDIFIGSEGILVHEEPWNTDVIQKVFPQDLEVTKNKHILCSGVIAGTRNALVELYKKMWEKCESGNLQKHNIVDQAALICLEARREINGLKTMELSDAWAVHCAVAGPTHFFESWGFKRHIENRYGIPYIKDGKVYTAKGELFDIVHQFNRIQDWNNQITSQYE